MRRIVQLIAVPFLLSGQTGPEQAGAVLKADLQTPEMAALPLRQYLIRKAPKLPAPSDAAQWTAEAKRLRREILDEVVFHGWPREWVDAPLKMEDAGTVPSGPGYRMRKLRYEIVPGFYSTAVLYEPESSSGKAPGIVNVNGHVGPPGKAVEYKQKRCINMARRGIVALNLEWLSFGELAHPENVHWFGAHLDLVGANAVGLFYLAMRKGLDILEQHPGVDPARLGVTGLSGGGWQTIILSALDERVAASVPVAGYSALRARIEREEDTGDIEQNATDLLTKADYPHLTAMRAPRPTLLIYNAEDDCCFRAPLVKPDIYDAVKPFFRLYGAEDKLGWHENTDPSDHNYQLDNRLQAYRFFSKNFGLPESSSEIPVGEELKTVDELRAGIPAGNLTIVGLARKLAGAIERPRPDRDRLAKVVRYRASGVDRAWVLRGTKSRGLETRSYRFEFDNGLSATGVWLNAIGSTAPRATILLNDKGKKEAQAEASDRVNRGEQTLAADLLFTGDAEPGAGKAHGFAQMISTVGERALGLEAAQLIGLSEWLRAASGAARIHVRTAGMRSQAIALVAAALRPELFDGVEVKDGIASFQHLLDKPVEYQAAPDLFCLDLYKEFDIDGLAALGAPPRVTGLR
ncbi:MAG: acetylxylan esterase [Bryobacteraceae bacterium]|nr:acetylxylan esterase [Bryobacteraceae bacterium]